MTEPSILDLRGSCRSGAAFSPCGRYRYALWRHINAAAPVKRVLWVMLNPSTADEKANDNTIRAVIRLSDHWGFSDIDVGNLYAWRSTDPLGLKTADDPVGPHNSAQLCELATSAALIVAAWGTHAEKAHAEQITGMLSAYGELKCLGMNARGTPKHPLFISSATPLMLYMPKWHKPGVTDARVIYG
jgi:hypothetical protein